jgi:hypothetical protein
MQNKHPDFIIGVEAYGWLHEAELKLTDEQHEAFIQKLWEITPVAGIGSRNRRFYSCDSRLRALALKLAFLRDDPPTIRVHLPAGTPPSTNNPL